MKSNTSACPSETFLSVPSIPFAPARYESSLIARLSNSLRPAFAQVATLDELGFPDVRTVNLQFYSKALAFGFNTNRRTAKYQHLVRRPNAAGCFYDVETSIQYRWKARVRIFEVKSTKSALEEQFLSEAWLRVGPDIRRAYWKEHGGSSEIDKRCPDAITVLFEPFAWDVYHHNLKDYKNGHRFLYASSKTKWIEKRVSTLTGAPKLPPKKRTTVTGKKNPASRWASGI